MESRNIPEFPGMLKLAQNIKQAMQLAGVTDLEICELINVPCKKWNKFLQGDLLLLSFQHLHMIADYCNVPVNTLIPDSSLQKEH